MMRMLSLGCLGLLLVMAGCAGTQSEINPFVALTEALGISAAGTTPPTPGGGQVLSPTTFRRDMTITFRNNHPQAEVNTLFVAWVSASSLRSAQQQDALFADGYVQLSSEVRLGTAFTLPVGTFVYNGEPLPLPSKASAASAKTDRSPAPSCSARSTAPSASSARNKWTRRRLARCSPPSRRRTSSSPMRRAWSLSS